MKVRATRSIQAYYKLTEGEEYEVRGIVYFVTPYMYTPDPNTVDSTLLRGLVAPFYSYGLVRNETVYIIECLTETGRRTLARFNVSSFEVVDPTVPDDWSTSAIDWYTEVKIARDALFDTGNDVHRFDAILADLKKFNAKIIAVGGDDFRSPQRLYAICDDNSDEDDE